jgi:hypothetical protein
MTATLENYGLRFHKRSRDGSGKCNIVPDDEETVHGVVFDVSPSDLYALDEAEREGRRYRRTRMAVEGGVAPVEAFTYVAQPAYVDDALLPYEWYRALVAAGAREHDLPATYVEKIEAVRAYPDPDEERRRQHRTLLHEAGYPLLDS